MNSKLLINKSLLINYRKNMKNLYRHQINNLSSKPDTQVTQPIEYPPIPEPLPPEKRKLKEWYDQIRKLPTIEEKLVEMTRNPNHIKNKDERSFADCRLIPKEPHQEPLGGYKIGGISMHYATLPATQHITRTKLINSLPNHYYSNETTKINDLYDKIKPSLEETLIMNHEVSLIPWHDKKLSMKEKEKIKSKKLVNEIFRILRNHFNSDYSHLRHSHVDRDARVESFWTFGFPPTEKVKKERKEKLKTKNKFEVRNIPYIYCHQPPDEMFEFDINENIDEMIYFSGRPSLQLRTETRLPSVVDINDAICSRSDLPVFNYVPRVCELKPKTQWPMIIPGIWPGNPYEFGHTCFYTTEDLHDRFDNLMGTHGEDDALKEYAITSSFGWLMAFATYRGYGPYNELKTPLVCQTVLTNAQKWSFYVYQMNTCNFTSFSDNKRSNLCWAEEEMKLYDEIDNGKIKGLNDDVFKRLVMFLLKNPIDVAETKEFVGEKESDEEKWEETMNSLRARYSPKQFRRLRKPFDWERIYLHNNAYPSVNPNRRKKKSKDLYELF